MTNPKVNADDQKMTRASARKRKDVTTIRDNSQDVVRKRQRGTVVTPSNESLRIMVSSQSSTASSSYSSIGNDNCYVEMQQKVEKLDRQLQSLVSTIKDVMAREKKTNAELRELKQTQKESRKKQKTVVSDKDKNQLQKNIQDFVKTKFYRHLKFVEDDTMPKIFARVIECEENKLPEGMLPQEEHDKLVTNCIRKAFTNLRHNSQTLIRRNYKRK